MDENQLPEALGPLAVLFGGMFFLVWCAVLLFIIASAWKIFTKAGKPGWAAIVPIYNVIVLLDIIGRPRWWILLFLVPLLGIVIGFIVAIDLARSFGKGTGFGVGLALLGIVFYPILGFGNARYLGPAAGNGSTPAPQPMGA